MSISVIVVTYEWPQALDAVLRSLSEQSDPDFDLVVADDGSGAETAAVVERWRHDFGDRLSHVWQPDEGFRLARARNLGALAGSGDYLVFLDGDCVTGRHYVRSMKASALPGWFAGGRRIGLSRALTERIVDGRVAAHRWSRPRWLLRARRHADNVRALTPRDRRRVGNAHLPDFEPLQRAYGPGLGVARRGLERVNGFDMRFVGWGDEDVDFAVRLRRLGLRCGHAGPQAALFHLWHPRDGRPDESNWLMLQETAQNERIEAAVGLRELAAELGAQVSAKLVRASSSSSEPANR